MSQGDGEVVLRAVLLREFDLEKIYFTAAEAARKSECRFNGISLYALPSDPPSYTECLSFSLGSTKIDALTEDILSGLGADRSAVRFSISPVHEAPSQTFQSQTGLLQATLLVRLTAYLRKNWGSPFIVIFIVLLLGAAAELSYGLSAASNSLAVYAFYSLVLGVALQIASYVRYGESDKQNVAIVERKTPSPLVRKNHTRTLLMLVVVALLSISLVAYYAYSTGLQSGSRATSVTSPGASLEPGCAKPGTDGTVFISTNVTASVEICGKDYTVSAGAGGGLTYSYDSGPTTLVAPESANGSLFEYWYEIVGGNPGTKVTNSTLEINLPAGLSAASSLIEAFFLPPSSQAESTKSSSTSSVATSTSTSTVTVTSTLTSSTTETTSSKSTSSSTTSVASTSTVGCSGNDGSVFVSTNVMAPAIIDICGQEVQVPGGAGGGLTYDYSAGNITLIAPTTLNGQTFMYWSVILPSGAEQFTSSQITLDLPAGYDQSSALIVAYYG